MSSGANGKTPRELQYDRFRELARKLGGGSLENELEDCLARLVSPCGQGRASAHLSGSDATARTDGAQVTVRRDGPPLPLDRADGGGYEAG